MEFNNVWHHMVESNFIIMKKLKFIFIPMMILVLSYSMAHMVMISGTVSSAETGLPVQGVTVSIKSSPSKIMTDSKGVYAISANPEDILMFSKLGYMSQEVKVGNRHSINIQLMTQVIRPIELVEDEYDVIAPGYPPKQEQHAPYKPVRDRKQTMGNPVSSNYYAPQEGQNWNTENYSAINENIFHSPQNDPLSTFSIDVDAASYSNVRRFLNNGQQPPIDAVRIEEMINYFTYDYEEPNEDQPFSINTEVGEAPWNSEHKLVHIGLQGRHVSLENLPPSNIVFLLDVSGSMNAANKLPLLKSAFKMLINQMREEDKVSIVVYAGAAGVVLEPTSGANKKQILEALNSLQAGGSTAGGAGIQLAYKLARENFVSEGNNRVVLATDGDFNIGASSDAEMQRLIEKERESGVFLTVLGFGMGNYKDSKMEVLADKGNGNYAYIDNLLEAKKVLVNEFGGTMFTIAKDVKIQVEFNPALVQEYRLIGYENRILQKEDFNNDKKDAGELGAGHTVTALYEIIPTSVNGSPKVDPLKYQTNKSASKGGYKGELLTVKLRYKKPDGQKSVLLSDVVKDNTRQLDNTSDNFRWSASVAEFGMLLRDSEFKGNSSYKQVIALAKEAQGKDKEGYRAEFIRMINAGEILAMN
jgi:Ca-activated chloride channel family protein